MRHTSRISSLFIPFGVTLILLAGVPRLVLAGEPEMSFRFDRPAVPNTTRLPLSCETPGEVAPCAWDIFAWNTFIALNWPAVDPGPENGYLRGYPKRDGSEDNFVNAGDYHGPLVWETFKEKREMFFHGAQSVEEARPEPWNVPFEKRVYGTAKFTAVDETVEVAAEALEPLYLTKQYSKRGLFGQPVLPRVFRGKPVEPSKGNPGNAVRYEVKVNYDFYKYVVDNGLFYDETAAKRAQERPPAQLPWRTSLMDPGVNYLTQKPADPPYVEGYVADDVVELYEAGATIAKLTKEEVLPPRIGAIHLKAAWAPIDPCDPTKYICRTAEYFVGTDVTPATHAFALIGLHIIQRIKVATSSSGTLNNRAQGGTFIFSTWEHREIQPTAQATEGQPYYYTNYFVDPLAPPSFYTPIPPVDQAWQVQRQFCILPHTQKANQAFWSALKEQPQGSSSVWSNYRLVGTQFQPIDIASDPTKKGGAPNPPDPSCLRPGDPLNDPTSIGQPAYLSNLVIETNLGLQIFQGQPPNLQPVSQFGDVAALPTTISQTPPYYRTRTDFEKAAEEFPDQQEVKDLEKKFGGQQNFYNAFGNLRFGDSRGGSNAYSMGGCMGCHGVAQLNGFSFSFVLLGGQFGADPDSEKLFKKPPTAK